MDTNKTKLLKILEILKNNGVDITKIPMRYSKDGKRYFYILSEISQDGIDMSNIIFQNGLDGNFEIGKYLKEIRLLYTSNSKKLTEEERKVMEEMGIVSIVPEGRQAPLAKGSKVSQFHIDIVKDNISRIISGELNTKEVIALINKKAEEVGETQIKDNGTIKRIVKRVLADKPEEYKKYEESLKHHIGARSPKSLNRRFQSRQIKFEDNIIQNYLPKVLQGEMTLEMMEKELKTSGKTICKIVKKYYLDLEDKEGFENFQKAVRNNIGANPKIKRRAKELRESITEYKVVTRKEFIFLSPEEQENQLIMKIRQEKLKEELSDTSKAKTAVISELAAQKQIERIKDYFRKKNDYDKGLIYFSEQDIRNLIFAYPTIISRTEENLDEKIGLLTSYEELSKDVVYGMIKSFPAILGYSVDRTKMQLDLLESENLLDSVVSRPARFMRSPALMYALIQYAKERHKTADLSDITRSNIFQTNSGLERLYGTTYDEIKERYPFPHWTKEDDIEYSVDGQDLGMAGYSANIGLVDKASELVSGLVLDKAKEERKE